MARKGNGKEAKLCYVGHTLTENRHGLIVECELTQATGTAEREAGLRLVARQRHRRRGQMSVAADKGYSGLANIVGSVQTKGIGLIIRNGQTNAVGSVLVGVLAAFCLLGVAMALAGCGGKSITGTTSFSASGSIVSADSATRTLVVKMESGSKSVDAYRGQRVTLRVDESAKIVNMLNHGRPFTMSELRSGARVDIVGSIDRTDSTLPLFTATKIVAQIETLLWSDEFNGPAGAPPNPIKWRIDTGGNGFGHNQLQYYTTHARNVALDGQGHLAITALRQTYSADGYRRNYTSGKIETSDKFTPTFGSIQASIKLPMGRGLDSAFWAVGANRQVDWPQGGEIDVMEHVGQNPFMVQATIHGPTTPASPQGYALTTSYRTTQSLAQGFHVYGLNWSPNFVQMTLDGVSYATYTPSSLLPGQEWVFNKPFVLILNLAVGGNWPGAPNATTKFPATMLVDWIRIYSWK